MFLTELSIKRPVIATVMSLVLVLFGIFTFNKIHKATKNDAENDNTKKKYEYFPSACS